MEQRCLYKDSDSQTVWYLSSRNRIEIKRKRYLCALPLIVEMVEAVELPGGRCPDPWVCGSLCRNGGDGCLLLLGRVYRYLESIFQAEGQTYPRVVDLTVLPKRIEVKLWFHVQALIECDIF